MGGINVISVDQENFEKEVLESENIVLVDFWSDGCEPCKALMPDIITLEEKYGDRVKFVELNALKARRLAIKQRVLGLPTVVIYKNGEKLDEVTADKANKASVEEMIKKYI